MWTFATFHSVGTHRVLGSDCSAGASSSGEDAQSAPGHLLKRSIVEFVQALEHSGARILQAHEHLVP